jgi:hypothetical protein
MELCSALGNYLHGTYKLVAPFERKVRLCCHHHISVHVLLAIITFQPINQLCETRKAHHDVDLPINLASVLSFVGENHWHHLE